MVKTNIAEDTDTYTYRQQFFITAKPIKLNKNDFIELVNTLNYLESIGFVHGDLNKKNIIYTQYGFKIIDYEPSLAQQRNSRKLFMVTNPYISKLDIEEGMISLRTDKLAFYYFILRSNNVMTSKMIVSLSKTLHHQQYIGMTEDKWIKKSYMDILNEAYYIIDKHYQKDI